MIVPSAPLEMISYFTFTTKFTYEGQRAYGKESGPWSAGMGRGGELAHVIQPTEKNKPQHRNRRLKQTI
jgi:hypothetical protein